MENILDKLQEALSPDFLGIIWSTSTPPSRNCNTLKALDYFVDGLILKNLPKEESICGESTHFFLSKNFGKPFFIYHICGDKKKKKEEIKKLLPMISKYPDNKKVLMLSGDEIKHELLKDL